MMAKIDWEMKIDIKNVEDFKEKFRVYFMSKNFRVKLGEDEAEFNSPFRPVSNKFVNDMIDGGKIKWEKIAGKDAYLINISVIITRLYIFWVVLPVILILFMFGSHYFSNPDFMFHWIKLAVILLSPVGILYIKFKIPTIKNYMENTIYELV